MLSVFFSYSHEDETLRNQLEQQLAILSRQQVITTWHDRRITAGEVIDHAISGNLEAADIILLLVSPAFLASDYCYDREMLRAMERHEAGKAVVIPVILRPCEWHRTPFGKILATPTDGKPVTQWPDRDTAFLEVARAIRAAAEKLQRTVQPRSTPVPTPLEVKSLPEGATNWAPRSSNLRIAKTFTERDRDAFQHETFNYIARFFEASLVELQARNKGIEGAFRRIDANRFSAAIYLDGRAIARCTVFMGGAHFASGIAYSADETNDSNSFNENLNVEADEQMLYLKAMGMAFRRSVDEKLSQEGAAELYWGMLIEPLQRR
ncbi:hypothetical protein CHX26_06335 [Porphyrobacter sp. HT-58-2]|uniref:toll/interleukin-1 receptor domain-containing protein n=1 Tax=Porphyrobacter sp. HT-58-2 TaxID=2023229 RepID=UPI000CDBEE60|nr:toll/interleukin-1 receptor domain-containing protein [Porphyrobacter sp. HT-58-2]AUX69169.1 hypothetical protein CHX26_06335 [Porphyrobacter sp. HT-58-2]